MTSTQFILNLDTQQSNGQDNNFTSYPNKQYRARYIKLNSFTCANVFSNFRDGFTDFSFESLGVNYTLTIQQVHLTITQFVTYFNANNTAGLTLTLSYSSTNPNISVLTGNQTWSPTGLGWEKTWGYLSLYPTRVEALAQTSDTYFNFMQSSKLNIQLTNIGYAYTGDDGLLSFSLPLAGISTFGQQYLYESPQENTYQIVDLGSSKAFSYLQVRLLDSDYRLMQTVNTNNSNFNIVMTVTLYDE